MSDDARYADSVAVEGGSDNITLLLAAAEESDTDPTLVRTQSDGTVLAPEALVKKAKLKPIETGDRHPPRTRHHQSAVAVPPRQGSN